MHRDIVVVGASAGGIDPIKVMLAGLPADLPAALFVVVHVAPQSPGYLPVIFSQAGSLPAKLAADGEAFQRGNVYVAAPDRHLILTPNGRLETPKGPRENRVRPAVDPLFRSAALGYGGRVIGIVLSGGLDDGTAGLRSIKMCGGTTIVQDPADALVESMPVSALRNVTIDYCEAVEDLAPLITRLVSTKVTPESTVPSKAMKQKLEFELNASRNLAPTEDVTRFGDPSIYTCPECHGTLLSLRGERPPRFRCHTGHAFTADSLLAELSEATEEAIWNSIRAIQESALLLTHLADHWRETDSKVAEEFDRRAAAARLRAELVHRAALAHEQLSETKVVAAAHK
jgi:two-component system, chemotaxis family, protein-glutamate methylesterase/glutaminase